VKTIVVVNSETLVERPADLGRTLMGSFMRKLWASPEKPDTIIFYGSAVRLLTAESHVKEAFDALLDAGVDLVACGTCLGYFELKDRITVGRIGDMQEIVAILMKAEKVVTV